jgi:hypothetical protein
MLVEEIMLLFRQPISMGCVAESDRLLGLNPRKIAMRTKASKAMLMSDSVALAGMPSQKYESPIAERVVLMAEGRLHLVVDPRFRAGPAAECENFTTRS